ncbi:cysteine hydrolase, partial [Acinetobacter baumannii]|nr:cysteine hydrolase [Acinetobacter baumannii]
TATRDLSYAGKTAKAEDVQIAFLTALSTFANVQNTTDFLASS